MRDRDTEREREKEGRDILHIRDNNITEIVSRTDVSSDETRD